MLPRNGKDVLSAEALTCLALSRGWIKHGNLPDETRTGRMIIKDYVNGLIPHWQLPFGFNLDFVEFSNSIKIKKEKFKVIGLFKYEVILYLKRIENNVEEDEIDIDDDIVFFVNNDDLNGNSEEKIRRKSYKFQKKPKRTKGNRGRQYNTDSSTLVSNAHIQIPAGLR